MKKSKVLSALIFGIGTVLALSLLLIPLLSLALHLTEDPGRSISAAGAGILLVSCSVGGAVTYLNCNSLSLSLLPAGAIAAVSGILCISLYEGPRSPLLSILLILLIPLAFFLGSLTAMAAKSKKSRRKARRRS